MGQFGMLRICRPFFQAFGHTEEFERVQYRYGLLIEHGYFSLPIDNILVP